MILHRFYMLFVKSGLETGPFGHPFIPQNVLFSIGFESKSENLCCHGTGSEESAREGVHGHQEEEVA